MKKFFRISRIVLCVTFLAGCSEQVNRPEAVLGGSTSTVTAGVNQYNAFPAGWKFPFFGSSRITVGYNGVVCGGGYDGYHSGNERYAVDWSRLPGNGDLGDPIPAPASGWATPYFSSSGYGNHIRVDAGNGYSYLIAHMDQITLHYCGWVERGQLLGTVGCSGNCDGAHIHFVVYRYGASVPQNGISNQWNLVVCGWYASGQ